MIDYSKLCVADRQMPIQQLDKLNEKGTKRENFFPITVIQAVFDKTGIRLDAIISSFNYIFLPYKGTKEDTRLQVVGLMRRKSLVICYRDLDDNTIIEMYNSNDRNDDAWKSDDNWIDFSDYIKKAVEEILTNLNDYPDIVTAIQQACIEVITTYLNEHFEEVANEYFNLHFQDSFNTWIQNNAQAYFDKYLTDNSQTIINSWLQDNSTETINNWLAENAQTDIKNYLDSYLEGTDFGDKITNETTSIVNNYLGENLEPLVGEFFTQVVNYLRDNERVIANALARHEQAITQLQNR